MPTIKPNQAKQILEKIFKDPGMAYGLKEFEEINLEDVLDIREQEKRRFYIKDLKSGGFRFVFDEEKNQGRPEEIIRQLWLHKLHEEYHYPFERMDIEKKHSFWSRNPC